MPRENDAGRGSVWDAALLSLSHQRDNGDQRVIEGGLREF
jgi:hypothetical protein